MSTSGRPGDAGEARRSINPDDSPRGAAATPRQAFLFLRIWMPSSQAPDGGSVSWGAEESLIQMIADLVTASGGSSAGKRRNGLIACFRNAAEASAAAIRLQQAIAGFAAQSKASAGAAVALFSEDKAGGGLNESSDELETACVLASAARPEQILLTAAAYAELNLNAPYTSRSAAPFRMPGGTHSNLKAYQLAWNAASPTSSERPRTDNATLSWATARDRTTEPTRMQPSPASPDAHPRTFIKGSPTLRPQTGASDTTVSAPPVYGSSNVISPAKPEAVPHASPWRLRLYAAFAAVIVALVAVGAWIFTRNPHAPAPPPYVPTTEIQPKAEGDNKVTKPKDPTSQPSPKLEPERPNPPAPVDGPPAKEPSEIIPPAPNPPPAQKPQRPCKDGFCPSDISWLLAKADRESGDGDYDAAERHYRIVQALEPSNKAARNGLRRNEARRSEQQ